MTEIEKVKAEIKLLEKKVALLEEIEKQPKMTLEYEGQIVAVRYNKTDYYRIQYASGSPCWWRPVKKGVDTNYFVRELVKDAETKRMLEQMFSADICANPEGSLKFTFGPTLYDVIENWWSDIFCANSMDDMETCIDTLVDRIKTWLPKEQSAAGSQCVGVEDLVAGWNDCLDTIRRKLG
jgi:hypothetical protein